METTHPDNTAPVVIGICNQKAEVHTTVLSDSKNESKQVIQCCLTLIRLVSTLCVNSKAIPTNDTDNSCHIKVKELV